MIIDVSRIVVSHLRLPSRQRKALYQGLGGQALGILAFRFDVRCAQDISGVEEGRKEGRNERMNNMR